MNFFFQSYLKQMHIKIKRNIFTSKHTSSSSSSIDDQANWFFTNADQQQQENVLQLIIWLWLIKT
jgi:hypothetical protein